MRKTKIVCTIGPASESPDIAFRLLQAGCDVVRFNFSHGSHAEHARRVAVVREAARRLGREVAFLLDTKGPEVRTGEVEGGAVRLEEGARFVLTPRPRVGDAGGVSVSYPHLARDVRPGQTILIDDGLIALVVEGIDGDDVVCRVQNGGVLKNRKGVNVPGVRLDLPAVDAKDEADIRFAIEHAFDFIAASFVRTPDDVHAVRRVLEEAGAGLSIIAKIENAEGVENAEAILAASDGLMIARGDLGVEIPPEDVPHVQKRLIALANRAGKPVITATQMLDSMQERPRPTRAEASDVANAILDGTDAVMLSGETAAGRYPVEAVETMVKIAVRAERELAGRPIGALGPEPSTTDVIGRAAREAAERLGAAAIIAPTESGFTARMIAKYRPVQPIVAVTPHRSVLRKLRLVWGVYPLLGASLQNTDEMMKDAIARALDAGYVRRGDLVVLTAGVPLGESGTTNLMKIHVIGDILARGQGIGGGVATGRAYVIGRGGAPKRPFADGDILVTVETDETLVPLMARAGAIVTEVGGLTSHAAIVGLELGRPAVVGAEGVTESVADGSIITVDARHGHVYLGRANVL
ncbi:MAG: pyruvate kinase [Hydrogenibacillus schlegelii]|nr:pyruvate kinase [Hydrogenibacillus schlegelii]